MEMERKWEMGIINRLINKSIQILNGLNPTYKVALLAFLHSSLRESND